MNQEIKNQFKAFVENHINNPFIENKFFTDYDKLGEEDFIFLAVESGSQKHLFEYSSFFTYEDGSEKYDFSFYQTI